MVKVGIIGSGFIVPVFIEATKVVGDYKYVAIGARNKEKGEAIKEKYDIGYFTDDIDKMLEDENIDTVYVAIPNGLHYYYAKKSLLAGKNVILEKPFTVNVKQAEELINLAKEKELIIFDAVTLLHMPNYEKIKELLPQLGTIKMVDLNFSQYSSRYDKFKNGIVLPAFDPKLAGGAIMDLGIYNINFVVGLFGLPQKVNYFPNMEKGIDTSGVLVMDYGTFKVNSIAAKDCRAPLKTTIQGDKGYIQGDCASSVLNEFRYVKNDGTSQTYALNQHVEVGHYHEYIVYKQLLANKDLKKAQEFNELTLKTMKVLEDALSSAGINFDN